MTATKLQPKSVEAHNMFDLYRLYSQLFTNAFTKVSASFVRDNGTNKMRINKKRTLCQLNSVHRRYQYLHRNHKHGRHSEEFKHMLKRITINFLGGSNVEGALYPKT